MVPDYNEIERLLAEVKQLRADVERLCAEIWAEVHGRIQTIRGECTDEVPHYLIDQALDVLDDRLYAMTNPAGGSSGRSSLKPQPSTDPADEMPAPPPPPPASLGNPETSGGLGPFTR